MAETTHILREPQFKPLAAARAILEARVPPALRSPDWNQRWAELEAMASAPVELQQIGYSGRPMAEEVRQAFTNGHLTARECVAALEG